MTMIERVVQAIADLRYRIRRDEGVEPTCAEEARAAIAAMREPTEGMVQAVYDQVSHVDEGIAGYHAMIDAALEEK